MLFFVLARKSFHHFDTLQDEVNAVIENYNPVFSKDSSFNQNYYFNYTSRI